MKHSCEKKVNGEVYILLGEEDVTWHTFPMFASCFFEKINASNVQHLYCEEVFDAHVYHFVWRGMKYELFYEEWPGTITIDALENDGDAVALSSFLRELVE
ncbi:hypothetical protein [Chromobacterium haemolyticum]|uniref:hypothetical protein n=1 Tax=Chromobacterium haemolyticum TaxID=394935 RepID=UPI002446C333|nr:hypothetical protein [Chromobacterium haemolyticum]MDH0340181.1 hypothetical protein [Chromobacterium haemolyticum]